MEPPEIPNNHFEITWSLPIRDGMMPNYVGVKNINVNHFGCSVREMGDALGKTEWTSGTFKVVTIGKLITQTH